MADLDGSTPECAQVCALHTGPHLASLRKIEMVAVRSTNETTPNFFEFLTPPAPQGPMDPTGGGAVIMIYYISELLQQNCLFGLPLRIIRPNWT